MPFGFLLVLFLHSSNLETQAAINTQLELIFSRFYMANYYQLPTICGEILG